MIHKVKAFIEKHDMFHQGDRVVVGVSGGADSMALLACLDQLKEELDLRLFIAHVDHGLRGNESDLDRELVVKTARELNLPFYLKSLDLKNVRVGQSFEDAARTERYRFFFQLYDEFGAHRIALGHQFHDQAETILLHLLRGTGAEGLAGILPVRDKIVVRPLLCVTREEIQTFLTAGNIAYREDQTNRSNAFLRNRIRHELIPRLRKYNGRIEQSLYNLTKVMQIDNDYWEREIRRVFRSLGVDPLSDRSVISRESFSELHEAMQRRIIKTLLESASQDKNGINQRHIEAFLRLIREGHVGQKLSMPFQREVILQYKEVLIRKKVGNFSAKDSHSQHEMNNDDDTSMKDYATTQINIPATIDTGENRNTLYLSLTDPPSSWDKISQISYIDYDKLERPLFLRTVKPGDSFRPLGLSGKKKLKSFFIDRKVPREERKKIPLLVDRKRILWVGGMAISDDVKVTASTRTCLKIEII